MFIPDREFFMRDALEVAPNLLNSVVTTRIGGKEVAARITEVEAYHGLGTGDIHDAASHARMGKTARNASMWGEPGHLYVYLIYGIHSNMNIVCSPEGRASGVLLRAGEIISGVETALERRPTSKSFADLGSGPARLANALGIDYRMHDGTDLLMSEGEISIQIAEKLLVPDSTSVKRGPRVGVSGDEDTKALQWRFWLKDEKTVSKFR